MEMQDNCVSIKYWYMKLQKGQGFNHVETDSYVADSYVCMNYDCWKFRQPRAGASATASHCQKLKDFNNLIYTIFFTLFFVIRPGDVIVTEGTLQLLC